MKTATRPAKIKRLSKDDDSDEGVFEAIVATWDVDSVGDKIARGAFTDTLDEWAKSGHPIPVLWSHMHEDPEAHIGYVEEAEERDEGLWVRGRIDLDEPKSRKVFKLLKGGRVRQFSFAYDVLDGGPVEAKEDGGEPGGGYYELRKLKLFEVGPCLIGANQETELLAAKSAVGTHSTSTSDAEWDGPANESRLPNDAGADTYRQAYAWNDPDADPDTKAAWRFIHHEIDQDGTVGAANIQACTTGIGILNGGRGGTNIPDNDRQGVYNHLAKHLRDADVEPPELASAEDARQSAGPSAAEDKSTPDIHSTTESKAGRVLSAKNEGVLRDALDKIAEATSAVESVLDALDDQGKNRATPAQSATSEEPPAGAKGDEPARSGTASIRLHADLALLDAEVAELTS